MFYCDVSFRTALDWARHFRQPEAVDLLESHMWALRSASSRGCSVSQKLFVCYSALCVFVQMVCWVGSAGRVVSGPDGRVWTELWGPGAAQSVSSQLRRREGRPGPHPASALQHLPELWRRWDGNSSRRSHLQQTVQFSSNRFSSSGAVLVFLPGYDEIVSLRDRIVFDDKRFSDHQSRFVVSVPFLFQHNIQLEIKKVNENVRIVR